MATKHTLISVDNRLLRFDSKTPQRLVGAGALLIAAYTLFAILWPLRYSLLATWLVIEVIFYVFYWRPRYSELNVQPEPKHEPKVVDGKKTFQRFLKFCNDLPKGVDYEGYFSGWFKGAPFTEIKRDNAEDFMAYGFWYRSRKQMKDMGLGHIPGQMVDQLERTWGVKFERGFNSHIDFMGHLWEPLIATWRPLFFYLSTEAVGWFARQLLKRWGFEHHKHNGLSYFTLNLGPPRINTPVTHTRATSSSTLTDMAAAKAAVPGSAAHTVPGVSPAAAERGDSIGLPPTMRRPASTSSLSAGQGSTSQSKLSGSTAAAGNGSSSPADSPTKAPSRNNSGLLRSKSSPFEAGPPDWTPFADPSSTAARTASGVPADGAPDLGAGSVINFNSGSAGPQSGKPVMSAPAAAAAAAAQGAASSQAQAQAAAAVRPLPPLIPGLSTQASVMMRGMANPLQGALSEGLGSADTPVLFLHGVGGLPAYLEMILHVMGLGHPVIVVEFRGVSMRLGKVFTADEVADTVVGVLDKLGVKEACVVGHSYGTFIAGMLARHYRKRVHTLCLIDPVCFGMFMPHLLYNFLYRTPTWRGWQLHDLIEYLKDAGRLVASRDMHVCATFARRFYWSDLNLWPEDLAPGSVVLLSGKDDLMDAAEVKDMLDVAGHVKVMYNHELTHGAFLLDTEVKQAIMAEMRGLLARSGSAVVGLARPVLARTLTLMTHGFTQSGGRVRMKKGGGNGRYYVEDHGNQLVRTFTGNLTKMLATAGNGFRGSSSGGGSTNPSTPMGPPRDGKAATDGGMGVGGGHMEVRGSGGGDWSASRLMQTFSGPVRRRFGGGRSWGASADPLSEGVARGEGSEGAAGTAAGMGAGAGGAGKSRLNVVGLAGARGQLCKREGASGQPGVERIDEAGSNEELQSGEACS